MRIFACFAIFLLISLTACQSKKAIAFREAIVGKEQDAMNILVRDSSLNQEKLNHLINRDYKSARQTLDKIDTAFNAILKSIADMPAADIRHADELKAAATLYYTMLRDLELMDRKEITEQEAMYSKDTALVRMAQDSMLALKYEKLRMYTTVSKADSALHAALMAFNTANGL